MASCRLYFPLKSYTNTFICKHPPKSVWKGLGKEEGVKKNPLNSIIYKKLMSFTNNGLQTHSWSLMPRMSLNQINNLSPISHKPFRPTALQISKE
jgi:hypothetical protein